MVDRLKEDHYIFDGLFYMSRSINMTGIRFTTTYTDKPHGATGDQLNTDSFRQAYYYGQNSSSRSFLHFSRNFLYIFLAITCESR